MWTYAATGHSFAEPRFFIATTAEGTASDTEPDYYRVFCGFGHKATRYCVMRSLEPAEGSPLSAWRFAPNTHTKAVLFSEGHPGVNVAWISQHSGTTGSASADGALIDGNYVGAGVGCASAAPGEPGRQMRIRVLVSYLPDLRGNSDLNYIRTAVLQDIGKTSVAQILKQPSTSTCHA